MLKRLFALGTQSGMPRYVAFVGLIQMSIVLVPESVFEFLGIDSLRALPSLPSFVQYYINASASKNAVLVFWLFSPITLLLNSALFISHVNNERGFSVFLERRARRLMAKNKESDFPLLMACFVFIAAYFWATLIYLKEPSILGNAAPSKSILTMILIHGGAIALLVPAMVAVVATELRAIYSK